MPFSPPPSRLRVAFGCSVALLALLGVTPSQAQYKVIGADGKVTYTDRPPNAGEGRVTALGARSAPSAGESDLPFELRQVASRYPVTMYVSSGACEPCESGKALLRQRGIPYTEKQVLSADDSEALEKLSGGRDAPTLTIGSQVLRGMSADIWNSYLDAAGYPRESKLPATYQPRPASPIVERREAVAARPAPPAAPAPTAFDRAPVTSGGIQF
ncbi:MAG TPA: glutaredoxin family protein [Caldimonas sp.]